MAIFSNEQLVKMVNVVKNEMGTADVPDLVNPQDFGNWVLPLTKRPNIANRFLNTLRDEFIYEFTKQNAFTSPFDYFRKAGRAVGRGTYETHVNPAKIYKYDMFAFDRILNFYPSTVLTQYFTINREDTIPQTITKNNLKNAFTSIEGLSNFLDMLILAPRNANRQLEPHLVKELINYYVSTGAIVRQNMTTPTNRDEWEELAAKIQEIAIGMCTEPSSDYNNFSAIEGVTEDAVTQSSKDDIVIIADAYTISNIKARLLAFAFDKSEFDLSFHFVPVKSFSYKPYNYSSHEFGEEIKSPIRLMICDGGFIKLDDNLDDEFEDFNIMSMGTQRALQVQQTIDCRLYRNCVAFIDENIQDNITIDKDTIVLSSASSDEIEVMPNNVDFNIKFKNATFGSDGYGYDNITEEDINKGITVTKTESNTINITRMDFDYSTAGIENMTSDMNIFATFEIIPLNGGKVVEMKIYTPSTV